MVKNSNFILPSEKNFGITFSIFFFLVFIFFLIKGNLLPYLLFISLFFLFFSFYFSKFLKYPNLLWFKLGRILSKLINPIIMFILYFMIITPYGLLVKIFKKEKKNWHKYSNDHKFKDQF